METSIKERRSRFFHYFGLGMTVTKTLFKKACGMPDINLGVGAGCNTQIYRQLLDRSINHLAPVNMD